MSELGLRLRMKYFRRIPAGTGRTTSELKTPSAAFASTVVEMSVAST